MSIHRIKQPRFSRHSRQIFYSRRLPICSKLKQMIQSLMRSRKERLSLKSSHLIGGWSSLCIDKWARSKSSHQTRPTLMLLRMLCQLQLRQIIPSKTRKRREWSQSTSTSRCKPRFFESPTKQSLRCNSPAKVVLHCFSMRMWVTICKRCRSITTQGSKKMMQALNDYFLLTLTPRIITSIYKQKSTLITFL